MTVTRRSLSHLLFVLLVGGLLGGLVGQVLVKVLPAARFLLASTGDIGFNAQVLRVSLNVNVAFLLGALSFALLFRRSA
jgi:hypothetical protein